MKHRNQHLLNSEVGHPPTSRLTAAALLLLVFTCAAPLTAHSTTFTTIDYPGAVLTRAQGINAQGQIVGFFLGTDGVVHGFFRSLTGAMRQFDAGPGETRARSINASGTIAGGYFDGETSHCFVSSGSAFILIDFPNATSTVCRGINDAGDLSGAYADVNGLVHGFILRNGTFSSFDPGGNADVYHLDDRDEVVGSYDDATGNTNGFLLRNGSFTTIAYPNAPFTVARGINNRGTVVGGYAFEEGQGHGFVWRDGIFITLDVPGATGENQPFAINARGWIVGSYSANGTLHGFLAK